MKKLIQALQILLKYGNPEYPCSCGHDTLYIVGYKPEEISKEDKAKLDELGFIVTIEGERDEENDRIFEDSEIYSFKYGSA